jgi:hypothetical protein
MSGEEHTSVPKRGQCYSCLRLRSCHESGSCLATTRLKGREYHTHIQPTLSALLQLTTCETRVMIGLPTCGHQTDWLVPLDHHFSPMIVQLRGSTGSICCQHPSLASMLKH